jgi:hypothetical protein
MQQDEASRGRTGESGRPNVERTPEANSLVEEVLKDHAGQEDAGRQRAAPGARPDVAQGRRWPGLISIIALVFSSLSLYETILKQAALAVYLGEVGYFSRDKVDLGEIIALPVTIINHGARDAVVFGLTLDTDGTPQRIYRSSFIGGGPSAGQGEPFAPWAIAGRGSHAGIVQFRSWDAEPLITEKHPYRLCVTVRADASRAFGIVDRLLELPPPALSFVVEPWWGFSHSDLMSGKPLPLKITKIETIDQARAAQSGVCRTET